MLCTLIENKKTNNETDKGLILMRFHFIVHSFINFYVWDPKLQQEVIGLKTRTRNASTKQSHFITLDKKVCEVPLSQISIEMEGNGIAKEENEKKM